VSTAFDKRLAPWFEQRRWRVMTEKTGEVTLVGVKIGFRGGEFQIDQPGVFITPMGHRGRRGFLVIETDESGKDIPGSEQAFGEATLRRAAAVWGTIAGLPAQEGSGG